MLHSCFSNSPPVATGVLSLGSSPYCAWHYAVEGSAAPLLSDVAYALASKVTSKIFSKTRYNLRVRYILDFLKTIVLGSVDGWVGEDKQKTRRGYRN